MSVTRGKEKFDFKFIESGKYVTKTIRIIRIQNGKGLERVLLQGRG